MTGRADTKERWSVTEVKRERTTCGGQTVELAGWMVYCRYLSSSADSFRVYDGRSIRLFDAMKYDCF